MLMVAVRAQPRARRPVVAGGTADANGRIRLRVAVTAPAEDGRATRAVCDAVAEAFGVAASRVSLLTGGTSREKLLRIEGDRETLAARLQVLLAG
jgi:uncharacterized protein (TIGR00251 family)